MYTPTISPLSQMTKTLHTLFFEKRCILCQTPFTYTTEEKHLKNNLIDELHSQQDELIKQHLCPECAQNFKTIDRGFCPKCGFFFPDKTLHTLCASCLTEPPLWDDFFFVGEYDGILRDLILSAKFHHNSAVLTFLGKFMSIIWLSRYFENNHKTDFNASFPKLLIPIPLHPKRLKERGYNQSLILAQEFQKEIKRFFRQPLIPQSFNEHGTQIQINTQLIRKHHTEAQSTLRAKARLHNVKNIFAINNRKLKRNENTTSIKGAHILLIDDIATTNATLKEASKVLLKAGALRVDIALLAKTHTY